MAAPTSQCGMRTLNCRFRIADCGLAMPALWRALALRIRNPKSTIRNRRLRILFLAKRQKVGKEPIGPRDPRRQLPEEAQPGIHVRTLAHRGDEQSTLERRLAGIVHLDERDRKSTRLNSSHTVISYAVF